MWLCTHCWAPSHRQTTTSWRTCPPQHPCWSTPYRTCQLEIRFDLLIDRLEANQILVARSAPTYMPQKLRPEAKFSGITISDKKVPYIFLARESDTEEPYGRQVFTLTLLTGNSRGDQRSR